MYLRLKTSVDPLREHFPKEVKIISIKTRVPGIKDLSRRLSSPAAFSLISLQLQLQSRSNIAFMFDPLLQDGDNDKEKKRQKEYYKTPVEESGRVKAKRQIKWEMQKVGKVKKTE